MRVVPLFRIAGISLVLLVQMLWLPCIQAQRNFTGNFNNANELMTDISGKPIYLKVEYNVEGTPFYPDEYYKADIFIRKGKAYTGVYIKFNVQENLVLFKLPDGTELSAAVPIQRIRFTDTSRGMIMYNIVFESGFPAVDKQNEETHYQVMDSGRAMLLKHHGVRFMDQKKYGQASITRIFEQTEAYYMRLPDGTMKKIEKGPGAFLSLFNDKKAEIKKYIEENKLKCRKEDDWKKVIAYYNSLSI